MGRADTRPNQQRRRDDPEGRAQFLQQPNIKHIPPAHLGKGVIHFGKQSLTQERIRGQFAIKLQRADQNILRASRHSFNAPRHAGSGNRPEPNPQRRSQ